MNRALLVDIAPLLALLAAACGALVLVARLSRARLNLRQVAALHGDEQGAVQSLAFVITIPAYVMLLLFIVQLSQVTIAKVVVEYSAFAAARAAVVWLPASHGDGNETANQVAGLQYVGNETDANGVAYDTYRVMPGSPKFQRILYAAVMADTPISPSRNTGATLPPEGQAALASLRRGYLAAAPGQAANPKIPDRLRNKLAYAWNNTTLEVTIRHRVSEPPLQTYDIPPYREEFAPGEFGWQDQVQVKVRHDFALLPGPGRFLARPAGPTGGSMSGGAGGMAGRVDRIAPQIQRRDGVYFYSMSATATLHVDGEKPLLPYVQAIAGPARAGPAGASAAPGRSNRVQDEVWDELPRRPRLDTVEEDCCAEPPARTSARLLPSAPVATASSLRWCVSAEREAENQEPADSRPARQHPTQIASLRTCLGTDWEVHATKSDSCNSEASR